VRRDRLGETDRSTRVDPKLCTRAISPVVGPERRLRQESQPASFVVGVPPGNDGGGPGGVNVCDRPARPEET